MGAITTQAIYIGGWGTAEADGGQSEAELVAALREVLIGQVQKKTPQNNMHTEWV